MHGQVRALRPGVGHVEQHAIGKLSLNVEVPLFYARVRVVGNRCTDLRQCSTSWVEAALPWVLFTSRLRDSEIPKLHLAGPA
jgi:hypothetical protein